MAQHEIDVTILNDADLLALLRSITQRFRRVSLPELREAGSVLVAEAWRRDLFDIDEDVKRDGDRWTGTEERR